MRKPLVNIHSKLCRIFFIVFETLMFLSMTWLPQGQLQATKGRQYYSKPMLITAHMSNLTERSPGAS